ncbi:ribosomal protein YMR-31- mitochondrial [Apiospora kogelbergensis]|uniref:Ribosomal protein YMR-31- mitochondrial n=1 Tax=Apiospora kogelbergensis TaxID=1337665 RepID=A0AAW0R8B8_9PEZI
MNATRALRQAAHAAERTPLIRFVGRHSAPANIDHSPQPHPASPTGSLPANFGQGNSHTSFSNYRNNVQQHGPLRKTIGAQSGIGGASGATLGSVEAPKGTFFDRSQLPARFQRAPIDMAEIEAVESGGAALFG